MAMLQAGPWERKVVNVSLNAGFIRRLVQPSDALSFGIYLGLICGEFFILYILNL